MAQGRAFRELVSPDARVRDEDVARVGSIIASDNASAADSSLDSLFERVYAAASADLAALKRTPIWSGSSVELTLRLYDDPSSSSFSISKLPMAVEIAPEVVIVAPPGTGKTTTLLQLASQMLAANSIVPLYFRLADWSGGLIESLRQRSAFRDINYDDLHHLIKDGRVLLLLDGWNELDETTKRNFRREIEQIRREYPNTRIIASTRRQMLEVPVSGPRIAIEPLSDEQQLAIAYAHSGTEGVKTVDDAWRTAGIRELISVPLYLSALLSTSASGASPNTKEEILRLFVEQHDRASDHAEALLTTLLGCHAQILTILASHLNSVGTTTLTEAEARRIIATTTLELKANGQIVS